MTNLITLEHLAKLLSGSIREASSKRHSTAQTLAFTLLSNCSFADKVSEEK